MSGDSEAQAAINALNGTQFGGRTLTVNEARPQEPRPVAEDVEWRGGTNLRSFVDTYSGLPARRPLRFSHRIVLLVCRGHPGCLPCFPKIEI